MQMSQFIEALQADLRELAEIGGDELVQATQRLAGATPSSPRRCGCIDALTQVALDLSSQLPNGHIEIRLAGQDPQFVYVEEQPSEPVAGDDALAARITLRLPESLKSSIETAAESENVSVNAWLVRALQRAVSGGGTTVRAHLGPTSRITGFAQS